MMIKLKFLLLFLVLNLAPAGFAADEKAASVFDAASFRQIAVLENGRIKPMDTYAQNFLLRMSGRRSFDKKPAYQWMAKFLFTPLETREDKIFLIDNPAVAEALKIPVEKTRRYSFAGIEPAAAKLAGLAQQAAGIEPKERDLFEQEIIRLQENLQLYTKLSLAMAFTVEHEDFALTDPIVRKSVGLPEDQEKFAYIDFAARAYELQKATQYLETKPQAQWGANDFELAGVMHNLFEWSLAYSSIPLDIIAPLRAKDARWASPWDVMTEALRDKEARGELLLLAEMAKNYCSGRQAEFDASIKTFNTSIKNRALRLNHTEIERIPLELQFNQLQPFFWARISYLLALLFLLGGLALPLRHLRTGTIICLGTGFTLHAIGMAYRMMILMRPPVSTLYETFIFVALVCVLLGFAVERAQKQGTGHFIAAASGWVFLTIAHKFSMEGDTFLKLVAVLNSNFWLSTHVLSITIGYGAACVAGLIGHVYLAQAIARPKDKARLRETANVLVGALGFALITTFLGTNLGGIWADQSWGRFWGWDPKENGALLIVLWIAIILHAKIAKLIGPFGLAVASTFSIMVVVWAWFGVNLLSVGLHSYGFTQGLANNLMIYYSVHGALLAVQAIVAKQKLKAAL